MNLSDLIENHIRELMLEQTVIELKRSEIASYFGCVPSQINYVISTRFVPESGYYVESKRGGGGFIKITKKINEKDTAINNIIQKIDGKMSQHVVNIYLQDFLTYNIITKDEASLIKVATSDKSLANVKIENKDLVRADIFKNLIINLI